MQNKSQNYFTHAYKKNYSNILINHDWFTPIISLPADNPGPSSCGVCAARFWCRGFHNRIRHLDPSIQPGQRPESRDRLDRKPGFTHCADGFWFAEDGETDTTYETHVQRSMMTKTHCTEVDSILWRGDERVMSERRWCEVYTVKILEQTASSIPLPVHSVRQMSGLLQEDGRGRIDRRWRKGKDIYRDFLQN